MSRVAEVLQHVGSLLDSSGRAWALVGGLAVSVRCEPRFTRDIDLVVSVPSDAEAEALVSRLVRQGYRPIAVVEQTTRGGLVLDLLMASSGIEPQIAAAAERLEILPGIRLPVATRSH